MLTSLIPAPYQAVARIALYALLVASLVAFGWFKGCEHVQAKWDAANERQAAAVVKVITKQGSATVQTITKYVDRVRVVYQQAEAIIKEVPIYVSKESDDRCVVPVGLIRLRNDAAAGRVAESASGTTDARAGPSGTNPAGGSVSPE